VNTNSNLFQLFLLIIWS